MTTTEYQQIMELIEHYGDCCESFGEYQTTDHIFNCGAAKEEIEKFLKKYIKE